MPIGFNCGLNKKYLEENNFQKICSFNLCCFQINYYENEINCLNEFICYFCCC